MWHAIYTVRLGLKYAMRMPCDVTVVCGESAASRNVVVMTLLSSNRQVPDGARLTSLGCVSWLTAPKTPAGHQFPPGVFGST